MLVIFNIIIFMIIVLNNTGERKHYHVVSMYIWFDQTGDIELFLNYFFSVSSECVFSHRYFKTFLSVFLLTVVLGLGILAVVRLLLRSQNWSLRGHVMEQFDDSNKVCVCVVWGSEREWVGWWKLWLLKPEIMFAAF